MTKPQSRRTRSDGISKRNKQDILKGLSETGKIWDTVQGLGLSTSTFYNERRRDPDFDRAVVEAVATGRRGKRLRGGTFERIAVLSRPGKMDAEHLMERLLKEVRSGKSIAGAIEAVQVSQGTINRLRYSYPNFDRAVVTAVMENRDLQNCPTGPPPELLSPLHSLVCASPGCRKTTLKARGLCGMHYYRWYRTGRTGDAKSTYGRTTCGTPGCGRPHRAKGYCATCYDRAFRSGR